MPRSAQHREVNQLLARRDASQHKPAPAHVSAADEFCWEHQLFAEDVEQGIHVFRGGNAA